jgi:hypothetical protein
MSQSPADHYPDVIARGGMPQALLTALREIGSCLTARHLIEEHPSFPGARVALGPRSADVWLGARQRLFLVGIWAEGTKLASAETADLDETARIIDHWVASSCSTADLAGSFGCVAIEEVTPFYERGELAEFRWQQFLNEVQIPELRPFVEAASRRVQLRQLVPYTSLAHFRFHRCAAPHFLPDMPYVVPVEGDRFEVRGASGCVLGRGNAEEAADVVIANLPPGCGTAVPGTADCTQGH